MHRKSVLVSAMAVSPAQSAFFPHVYWQQGVQIKGDRDQLVGRLLCRTHSSVEFTMFFVSLAVNFSIF